MCSAQHGCFLQFLNFVLSSYVGKVFYEWLWDGSTCRYYYWHHICFDIPHVLYFYCKASIFQNHLTLSLDHNYYLLTVQHLLTCTFLVSLSRITMSCLLLLHTKGTSRGLQLHNVHTKIRIYLSFGADVKGWHNIPWSFHNLTAGKQLYN